MNYYLRLLNKTDVRPHQDTCTQFVNRDTQTVGPILLSLKRTLGMKLLSSFKGRIKLWARGRRS